MDGLQQGVPQYGMPSSTSVAGTDHYRKVTGAANTVTVLISLAVAREVFVSAANWHSYIVVHAYLAGRATTADLEAADSGILVKLASWPGLLLGIAAGVALIVWMRRARINAELMSGAAAHRRSRGWVVAGWITPVVGLWVPYQVMSDIWRASAPRRGVPVTLVGAWWAMFTAATVVVKPIQWRMAQNFDDEQDVLSNANLCLLLTALYLVAGTLLILVVHRITAWQTHGPAPDTR